MYGFLAAAFGPGRGRRGWGIVAVGLILGLGGLYHVLHHVIASRPPVNGEQSKATASAPLSEAAAGHAWKSSSEEAESYTWQPPPKEIESLCSTCHLLPPPNVEPKALWPDKIEQMYEYMRGPRPIPPDRMPPIDKVIRYWVSQAPEELSVPEGAVGSPPSPLRFRRRFVALDVIPGVPAVADVKRVRLGADEPAQWLITDMRWGLVILWTPSRPDEPARVLGRIPHPCRTFVADLDKDGLPDILVANLGEFLPADTDKGSVEWLRNRGREQFEPVTLIKGLGRVAEVQAADFDGSGKLSLIVADFGSVTTGRLLYLENCTTDWSRPDFEPITLDYHTGTSDVKAVDLNRDGRADFIAMQSQESEHVFAMLNRGRGTFRQETIYRAAHPRWGSTGIALCDLNGDGKTDVLLNHGDLIEFPPALRPYHGVSWLENAGTFPFTCHRLAHFPGAHTSVPADLDGDGRLDVVSSAFIPMFNPSDPGVFWPPKDCDSIIWLRQTSPGKFDRYSLETSSPFHPCAEVGDVDGDGDLDIVVGNFAMFPANENARAPSLTVLENLTVSPP